MSDLPDDFQTAKLAEVDPDIARVLDRELARQQGTLEMIASENFVPQAVLDAAGSVLTNKYAEGYPGKRYYGGCEYVDVVEQLAIDRAKELFGAEHANVQPHSGAQANMAVYFAILEPGDTILGMDLAHGGHLTHGMQLNFSGQALQGRPPTASRRDDQPLDYGRGGAAGARSTSPKLIVAGGQRLSAPVSTSRAFREHRRRGRRAVDGRHGPHRRPGGGRRASQPGRRTPTSSPPPPTRPCAGRAAGLILCKAELAKAIDSAVFPGMQGGPLMHVIAAKAVALKIAATEEFAARQRQTVANARAFAEELTPAASTSSPAAPTTTWCWST